MTNKLRGAALLHDPHLNKLAAFSPAEREALGLIGLLPEGIDSSESQMRRVFVQLADKPSDLEKYIHLRALQDTNETLFFRTVMSDPARFLPLVYTPTVGEACLKYSQIITRPRGLYVSINRKGRVREILRHWPERDVRFIVITSGQRILGLGDLGANGMGIPIGKLALYTACAGVPPQLTMPVMLDCGTDNETLLRDPLYLGLRQRRPPTAELDEFVDEFVNAVEQEFPGCCIQFEDWARADAFRLLARYHEKVCCFNDDVQGSGAAALAGLTSAMRITGGKLADQTILFLGAGSAALGIAHMLVAAMVEEGLSSERARARIWLFNRNGLIESTRSDLADFQKPYAHPHAPTADFVTLIESLRPSAIIGVSTASKAFNRQVIEAMARINHRPIVFALSNPTSRAECSAQEAYEWSEGRAIFASGSPFPPVRLNGRDLIPSQCNNMYIFPALGLALYVTRARRVTEQMLIAGARAVAELVSAADLDVGMIYPPQSSILETEIHAAKRIARVVFAQGFAGTEEPRDLDAFIESRVYQPEYQNLV